MRELLNTLSEWAIGPLFVVVSVGLALVGWWLVHRFSPSWRDAESSQTAVGVATMVMTLFALVLAFVIVNLYTGYTSASENVAAEANSLATLIQDARAFPPAQRGRIERAVADYVREVTEREFPSLTHGVADPRASGLLDALYAEIEGYSPRSENQRAFYAAVTDQLNAAAQARQKRLEAAESSIPGPLLALLIMAALLTMATTLLVRTHHHPVDVALIVSVAAVVGIGMFTALILEYPFSGSIAVSSSPFKGLAAGT